jgi:cytochrome c oxidase subunit 2
MADERSGATMKPEALLVGLLFLLVGVLGIAYGAREWAPPLASQHGAGIDAMLRYLLVTTGGMFLVGHIVLAWLIWRGSRRTRVTHRMSSYRTEKRFGVALGLVMALVAEGGVLAIGIPVWDEYFMADVPPNAVLIEVTGKQFEWHVRYPGPDGTLGPKSVALIDDVTNPVGLDRSGSGGADDIVTINQITVPVSRPVRIRLQARDVIHSFFLPHMRVKQDAIPGMSPEVIFVPTREGNFEIACTELCGLGHYRMQAFFSVVSQAEFDAWLVEQATLQ